MRPTFVAEVSSNHNQNLDRCLKFVDKAAEIGCGAVKFQLFEVEKLFHPHVVETGSHVQQRTDWELPISFLPDIAERAREYDIDFACSPFSPEAVTVLEEHVSFYKVASYELLWDDLLESCAETGKPVVLSTGMATLEEVAHAVDTLRSAGCSELTLLHCVSSYPVKPKDCNLAAIETLREEFDCEVGWSDHSSCPAVIHRAVHRWDSAMVEFHIDLSDQAGYENDSEHSWRPSEIGNVIQHIKAGFNADGDSAKRPTAAEQDERSWRADPDDGLRPLKKTRGDWDE